MSCVEEADFIVGERVRPISTADVDWDEGFAPLPARYPHNNWTVRGRPVVVLGEWSEDREHGYHYRFEDEPGEHWIRTGDPRIASRPECISIVPDETPR